LPYEKVKPASSQWPMETRVNATAGEYRSIVKFSSISYAHLYLLLY
jgi:hypothetical protein